MHLHLFSSVIRRAQHLLFHSDSLFSSVRRGVSGLTVLCSAFPYLQSCRHHVGSRWAVRCLNNHCFAAVLHIRFLTILKKLELSLLLVFTECQNKIQRILYESRSIKSYVFLLVGLCLIECYSFETASVWHVHPGVSGSSSWISYCECKPDSGGGGMKAFCVLAAPVLGNIVYFWVGWKDVQSPVCCCLWDRFVCCTQTSNTSASL